MSKIQPTVGRVVWYNPDSIKHPEARLAAHVASVIDEDTVNLMVIDEFGEPHSTRNVHLVHEGDCPVACCEWMPYQKGQAAKTDALEPRVEKLEAFAEAALKSDKEGATRALSGAELGSVGNTGGQEPLPDATRGTRIRK